MYQATLTMSTIFPRLPKFCYNEVCHSGSLQYLVVYIKPSNHYAASVDKTTSVSENQRHPSCLQYPNSLTTI